MPAAALGGHEAFVYNVIMWCMCTVHVAASNHQYCFCSVMQQIYEEGLYHPSVTQSITGNLFSPANFSTADVLQQNASMAAGFICTCGEFYDNPCREEIRAVSTCPPDYLPLSSPYTCLSLHCANT